MTELKFETTVFPAAELGEESVLPDIHVNSYIRASISLSDAIGEEDGRYIGKGMISTLLPYRIQDGYTRDRAPRAFFSAVLENESIRAVFLPELGGRLWSLYDKRLGRELLYKNDVFQPANLALRNAWFSGGVEWNVGIKGHNPLTASPLFTGRAYNTSGEPVLRMYEYERIRGVVYLIEATLSDDTLLVKVTIENLRESETPMYWWSNIAVPETEHTRVLSPAEETFFCGYTDGGYFLDKAPMPCIDGKDITYALASGRSRDFFFDIPKEKDKWVAAVDGDGYGLLQFSDPILKGRKLFVWGNHRGGRHWNEWLTGNAGPYVEIQAGLLKTQLEHFVMPGSSRITWQECYRSVFVDPAIAHGEYTAATEAVSKIVAEQSHRLSTDAFAIASKEPLALYGSGWGALEAMHRGEPISNLCEFPEDSLGEEQADWLALLDGSFPNRPATDPIPSYLVGDGWLSRMEEASGDGWYYYNHLGVMRYAAGDIEGARAAFLASLSYEENAWAYRNLAMIEKNIDGNADAAATHLVMALHLLPDYRPLAVECAETLLRAGRPAEWIEVYHTLSEALRAHGRLRMLLGAAYARAGQTDLARAAITADLVVDDIKEGEYALSSIWTEIYAAVLAGERGVPKETLSAEEVLAAYPLPYTLDFRMH